ncbi:ABC transporter substrate-binding protein [Azomonas agilis]|uniref:ABC transporter substrate-binding protein n=1 Tax=Azomonas agilis TaxID=116849 RepID=UPI001FE7EDC4|nr:ABC transporter substrate-binding protein [Azomonas agilis]
MPVLRYGLLWTLALVLSACQPNQDPETLNISGPFEFTSQDPSRTGYVYTRLQVAETLVEVAPDGHLLPGLAEYWSAEDGGLRWQFQLRSGVRFHDGQVLEAQTVVQALEIARTKPGILNTLPITQITAEEPLKLSIQLSRPHQPLPAVLAHFSAVILSPASYNAEGQVTWMQGTGPYRLIEFGPPHRLLVQRFEGYWGKVAQIPKVLYLTGHRAESRALQVMAGQTDIVYTLDPASLDLLKRRKDAQVHSELIPRTIQIKLNAGHPYLKDLKARQAISLALDRSGIATHVLRVPGTEANQLIPPMLKDWHLPALAPIAQDLKQAQALLQELGWQADEQGILHREGQRFQLKMITYADRPELLVIGTAIQAQLRALGIDMGLSVVNSSGIPSAHHDGSLELALIARNYGTVADPLSLLLLDFGAQGNGDWGGMNWNNTAFPQLLHELEAEQDATLYQRKAQQAAQMLVDELPAIPVLFYTQQTATAQRVKHFSFDPYERNYHLSDMRLATP